MGVIGRAPYSQVQSPTLGARAKRLHSFLLDAERSAVPRTEAGLKAESQRRRKPGEILLGWLGLPGAEGYS